MDRYFRNHSRCSQKVSENVAIPPATTPRSPNWVDVMTQDRKEAIKARASAITTAKGVTSQGDYLRNFYYAQREVADSLEEEEVEQYKEFAEAESQALKAPPTKEVVYRYVKLFNFFCSQ